MRLKKLKNALKGKGLFPYLLTDLNNIRYLTGFTGSFAFMLIDEKRTYFVSDSRYIEYSQSILDRSVTFVLQDQNMNRTIGSLMKDLGRRSLYLEGHSVQVSSFQKMKGDLRGLKLIPVESQAGLSRMEKDPAEIEILRRAADITDRCFRHLLNSLSVGMTEWEISMEIDHFYRKSGCRRTSFDSIVASGVGSSMPHYETSMEKKIVKGDIVLIDMGCHLDGYNSDLTRTVFMGTIDPEFRKIYDIVLAAQTAAEAKVRPGMLSGDLDRVARDIISRSGFGAMFGHSLGHGVGLEIHEEPSIKVNGELKLKKNMVITVEPGIYIPGRGGVRIEDMVLVTGKGREILTKSAKEIIIL